jgi:hypothetical protein
VPDDEDLALEEKNPIVGAKDDLVIETGLDVTIGGMSEASTTDAADAAKTIHINSWTMIVLV